MEEKPWVCVGIKDILEEALTCGQQHPLRQECVCCGADGALGVLDSELMPNTGRKMTRFRRDDRSWGLNAICVLQRVRALEDCSPQ